MKHRSKRINENFNYMPPKTKGKLAAAEPTEAGGPQYSVQRTAGTLIAESILGLEIIDNRIKREGDMPTPPHRRAKVTA